MCQKHETENAYTKIQNMKIALKEAQEAIQNDLDCLLDPNDEMFAKSCEIVVNRFKPLFEEVER